MIQFIHDKQQLKDFISIIEDNPMPFFIVIGDGRDVSTPQKEFFHASIVQAYSNATGLLKNEAKEELQKRHALINEYEDSWEVESIAGMTIERMSEFISDCMVDLSTNFGVNITPVYKDAKKKARKVKTKIIKKK